MNNFELVYDVAGIKRGHIQHVAEPLEGDYCLFLFFGLQILTSFIQAIKIALTW